MNGFRVEAQGGRRRAPAAAFLVGITVASAAFGATPPSPPCASLGLLASAGGDATPLAERLTVRFEPGCRTPFVVALHLRLAGDSAAAERLSAPREFRPGERFLPGEGYLLPRVFPEAAHLLDALFEQVPCGDARPVLARQLTPDEKAPSAGAGGAACVLLVALRDRTAGAAESAGGPRLAVLLERGR